MAYAEAGVPQHSCSTRASARGGTAAGSGCRSHHGRGDRGSQDWGGDGRSGLGGPSGGSRHSSRCAAGGDFPVTLRLAHHLEQVPAMGGCRNMATVLQSSRELPPQLADAKTVNQASVRDMPIEVATSSKLSSPIDGRRTYDGSSSCFNCK